MRVYTNEKRLISMKKCLLSALMSVMVLLSCGVPEYPEIDFVPGMITETPLGVVYLPADYSPDDEYPLLVLLHPMGTRDATFMTALEWREEADRRGYIVCSVRSRLNYWEVEEESPDREAVRTMVRFMVKNFPVQRDKICLWGFSSGAHFINTLLFDNTRFPLPGHYFSAFVAVSGGPGFLMENAMHDGKMPRRLRVPGYIVWGESEIPPPGKKMAPFLIEQGWDITLNPHGGLHFIPEGEIGRSLDWLDEKIP
jgi:poly(3-hydroxybutyrate) depolymerase